MKKQIKVSGNKGIYSSTGYRSVRALSHDGVSASQGAGFSQYQYDRPRMIAQSREFMRDNGIYGGMIGRAVGYIIGNGFGLQALSKSKDFNRKSEALWADFWRRPEVRGILSGKRVERMLCRELLTCGDTGYLRIKEGQSNKKGLIQLIEAEQIAGPKMSDDGIEKANDGRPTNYYISPYGKGGRVNTRKAKPVKPENFQFITEPDRPSSIRGVPPCQSVFAMLHRINDVCDSEAISWQILARMALSITRADGEEKGHEESTADTNASSTESAQRITETDYAILFHGEPGDEVKGIERNLPGKDFPASLTMFLRLLGLPLGLPLEVILLDWTKSNYSQSRAVLEQAYQAFLGWQMLIEDFSSTPLYEWKMKQWIKEKKLPPRKDALAHSWIKPTFPWIDQLKEAQAYGAKVDRSFTTHGAVCKSQGLEREDVVAIRDAEIRDSIEKAKKIEADTGEKVSWQLFAGLDANKAVPIQTGNNEESDDAKQSIDDKSTK